MTIVTLKDITKDYQLGKVVVSALRGISFQITAGDFVAIAGPSGSGKTTLLNLIGLIDKPSSGEIKIGEHSAHRLKSTSLGKLRQQMLGFIFQSFNLLAGLTVYENVELPLLIGGPRLSRQERKRRVTQILEEVGLSDRLRHRPQELSGGQQQRVAIARALVKRPQIVIADEPTANLDSVTGQTILSLMKRINAEYKTTFIFSTHDPAIHQMADHVIFLKDGLIEREVRQKDGDR